MLKITKINGKFEAVAHTKGSVITKIFDDEKSATEWLRQQYGVYNLPIKIVERTA